MKPALLFALLSLCCATVWAQADSCLTLLLLKKGYKLEIKPDMASVSETGFYLYRNCVYNIDLEDGEHISERLIDIKRDTLVFSNYAESFRNKNGYKHAVNITVSRGELQNLTFWTNNRPSKTKYPFADYEFIFKEDTGNCTIKSNAPKSLSYDTTKREMVPCLTERGVKYFYESKGARYPFNSEDFYTGKFDTTYRERYGMWYTPTNVEKIDGVAVGLVTWNLKNYLTPKRDSLTVNGVAIDLDPAFAVGIIAPIEENDFPDNLKLYNDSLKKFWDVKINGLNISPGVFGVIKICGVNICGAFAKIAESHGISISGLSYSAYVMNGLSIAGIYNQTTMAKGVQIGIFNRAADLRGIQIGLWNVNGRRSFPLINWQFSKRTKPLVRTGHRRASEW